jgi:hypothetical protein
MAISRTYGKSIQDYLDVIQKNVEEVRSPELKERLLEVWSEIESLATKLEGRAERQGLMNELDELQSALASCGAAGESGIRCMPFYERTVRVLGECRHLQ